MLRTFYLWLKQVVRSAIAHCDICGTTGVDSWSIHPAGLCGRCDAAYQDALRQCLTTKNVEDLIATAGKKEFLRLFGGVYTNPMVDTEEEYNDLRNQVCIIYEDEMDVAEAPCFDTFPGPPPSHPAQNCTAYEQSKAMGIGYYNIT